MSGSHEQPRITKRYLNVGLNGSNGYDDTEAFVGFTTSQFPCGESTCVHGVYDRAGPCRISR